MNNRTHIIVRVVIMVSLIVSVAATSASGKTIYVDDDASGANDGTSWENAYIYLQDALADANSAEKPVEIRVAQGIYKPDQGANQISGDRSASFRLLDGVTLKGGFAGFGEPDPNSRDVDIYETILSGDLLDNDVDLNDIWEFFDDPNKSENSYHVVTGSGTDPTAVLDGLTITRGSSGVWVGGKGHRAFGGGMYNLKGSPTLIDCTFIRNKGGGYGGGMYNYSSSPTLVNCTFNANWSLTWSWGGGWTSYGGGMYNRTSSPILLNCTFTGDDGGGMQNLSGSDPMLINCIFSGNEGGQEHASLGIHNSSGGLTIINCTFTGNSAESGSTLVCEKSNVNVINSIFWNGGNEISKDDDSNIAITYSNVQGGWSGEGNIDSDPCFAKPGYWNDNGTPDDDSDDFWVAGDYRLRSQAGRWDPSNQRWIQDTVTSPCIDVGDNSALPPWIFQDLDGHPRITNDTVDMGAYESGEYEFHEADFILSTRWITVPEAETATFTVMLTREPLGTVEVTVAHQSGDADVTVESGALLTFDSSNYAQPQTVTLAAAEDGDYLKGMALIWVSAPGLAPAGVIATELDNDATPPLYVDVDAVGANNGSSWEDAFINLQDALSLARTSLHIEQIRVAQGSYKPDRGAVQTLGDRHATFRLIDGVALMGGYAGFGELDPNKRDIKQYETILSGDLNGDDAIIEIPGNWENRITLTWTDNSYQVVEAVDVDAATVLDGFTITRSYALLSDFEAYSSGGMLIEDASPNINNCTFRNNYAFSHFGGGVYIDRSSPTLINCKFSANAAYQGGGMAKSDSNPTLINCTFSGNYATEGSAIGIAHNENNLTLINCTFSGNVCTNLGRSVIAARYVMLTNCIIWNNIGDRIGIGGNNATVSYSNIQGDFPGRGNINVNPLFADPLGPDNIAGTEDDDLRLAPSSPCIDAGDPDYKPGPNETDLAGKPRLRKGNPSLRRVHVDMGAYEFQCIIYVDDDAPGDPGPGNIFVSDPRENGSETRPRDNIQKAIDIAKDGYTVLVNGGVYSEPIDFKGKAITVTSGSDVAVLEGPGDYAVSFYSAEGPDSILKNFVIRNCVAGVFITGSSPTIRNLTLVDNEYGITAYTWAEPDISNCIFFNNNEADLFQCEARYSCIEDAAQAEQGIGNISTDPLFIDAANGDYHLRSEGWCWSTLTESWTYDYVTSPCIDSGDPACLLGDEPISVPRDPDNIYGENLRINMGAYGGTVQASMPPIGWTPP